MKLRFGNRFLLISVLVTKADKLAFLSSSARAGFGDSGVRFIGVKVHEMVPKEEVSEGESA